MIFDFVKGPNAGRHGELSELVGQNGIVVPPLGAWVKRGDESGPANRECLTHAVHCPQAIGHAKSENILTSGVPSRHHPRHVLLPTVMHDAANFSRGAESG